jgi:Asp-tRNA(Asn)/Glu-tRNA(Gln) amidotransferase A subunit family amidase
MIIRPALAAGSLLFLLSACGTGPEVEVASQETSQSFNWVEATIKDAHDGFADGSLSCVELVNGYLDRIDAYDRQGPTLNAIITTNPNALIDAAALDEEYQLGGLTGPLHCVPILLKDNFDSFDMPTTGGSLSLEGAQPPDDAFSVDQMRAEGAIILGKANLDEFAFGFAGSSSKGGLVHNPYDTSKGAGGSSSGTGSAIAASLAMIGTGSDTGGSIRVPSSVGALIGIRPSMRLVSQDGILPLAHFQDTGGPMCRTVQDCATLLDVMARFDVGTGSGHYNEPTKRAEDGATAVESDEGYQQVTGRPESYTSFLNTDGLQGARIGVVRALFGSNADVLAVVERALTAMEDAGATIEDVTIVDLSNITGYSSVSQWEFRDHLTEYLSSWSSDDDGHKRSFEEVAASGEYESSRSSTFSLYAGRGAAREQDADYLDAVQNRGPYVRPRLLAALENEDLDGNSLGDSYDALLYPSIVSLAANAGSSPSAGSNNRLSPFSGFPALSMPAGFADTDPALPVGIEILGREFDEGRLIELAYAYQQMTASRDDLGRQAPSFTPELP